MKRFVMLGLLLSALAAALTSHLVARHVFHRAPLTTDEQSYLLQAHIFSSGRLKYEPPPFIEPFRYPMVIVDEAKGWLSRYPPAHAMWLKPGVWLDNPHAMTALAAGLGVFLTGLGAWRLGFSIAAAVTILLLSPFFIFTNGTLMSHVSGLVASSAFLLGYILWQENRRSCWAALAGLAWAWLFLNRTYTAFLIAIPFGLDALWQLRKKRDRETLVATVLFASSAASGVLFIFLYNYLTLGNPLKMTYLFYDPTDKLGFGLRHHAPVFPAPLPVEHTPVRAWSDLKANILQLDRWLFGFRYSLVVWLALVVAGWHRRWSVLLIAAAVAVPAGYMLFWYPGWNQTGPNYYFEVLPMMVLAAAAGVTALMRRLGRHPQLAAALVILGLLGWLYLLIPFYMDQRDFFVRETRERSKVIATFERPREPTIILVKKEDVKHAWPGQDLVFTPHGIEGDTIVARWIDASNRALLHYFPDHKPKRIRHRGGRYVLEPMQKLPPFDITIPIGSLHRLTGKNTHGTGDNETIVRKAGKDDEAGLLLFGRFYQLYPGTFEIAFDARATVEGAGTLELAADDGRRVLFAEDVPVGADWQTIRWRFSLDSFVEVEPRATFHGRGRVEIKRVRIREVDSDTARFLEWSARAGNG